MNSEENLNKLGLLFDYAKSLGLEFELDWNDGDDEERKDNELFVYAVISQFDERSSQTFDRRIMGNIQKYMTR